MAKAETLEGDTSSVSPRTQHVIAFGLPTDGGLMVVQSVEELRRRVREGWRLTRDRKGFKMRGPGGRWERVSRDLEVVAAELYEAQRSERGRRARGCEGLLKEKERQCLEELSKCSNAYRPLLLKSMKLILELWQLAKVYEKGSPATPKEARDSLMVYVIPKARRLFIEIANVLKEKEGFDEDLLAEALVHTEL